MNEVKNLHIRPVLKESVILLLRNFFLIGGISFLGIICYALLEYVQPTRFRGALNLIAGIVYCWSLAALIFAVAYRYENRQVSINEAILQVKVYILRYIQVHLIYYLLVGIGFFLFVIPGIYFMAVFSLAHVFVILENKSVFESFQASKAVVEKFFWKILFLIMLVPAVYFLAYLTIMPFYIVNPVMAGVLALLIGMLYFAFETVVKVVLYYKLKAQELMPAVSEPQPVGQKRYLGCFLGCFAALILGSVILMIMGVSLYKFSQVLRTDKGIVYMEKKGEKYSPIMKFPGGARLDRPYGGWAIKGKPESEEYLLLIFRKSDIYQLRIESLLLSELGLSGTTAEIDNEVIGQKIMEREKQRTKILEKVYNEAAPLPIQFIDTDQKKWIKYELKPAGEFLHFPIVVYYTIYDDRVMVMIFRNTLEEESHKFFETDGTLLEILNKFYFPI